MVKQILQFAAVQQCWA